MINSIINILPSKRTFIGYACLSMAAGLTLASQCLSWGDPKRQEIAKTSLFTGSYAMGMAGLAKCMNGWKMKQLGQSVKGLVQTVAALAGAVFLSNLGSREMDVLHQSSLLALSGGYIASVGVKDLARGKYAKGAAEVVLGVSGVACSAYYVYHEIFSCNVPIIKKGCNVECLSSEDASFIENHSCEIRKLIDDKIAVGKWEYIRKGASKIVFRHPEMPGYFVKIPIQEQSIYDANDNDIRRHFRTARKVQTIIEENGYDRIVVPRSQLMELPGASPFLVEQRFYFGDDTGEIRSNAKIANQQLNHVLEKSGLCDVDLWDHLNVGYLAGTESSAQLGLYDFDCSK